MQKRWVLTNLILLIAFSFFTIISCSANQSSSLVVKNFYQAINKGEFEKAEKYLVPGEKFSGTSLSYLEGKIEKIEILSQKTGNAFNQPAAEVKVRLILKSEEEVIKFSLLEKHNGEWKIFYIGSRSFLEE